MIRGWTPAFLALAALTLWSCGREYREPLAPPPTAHKATEADARALNVYSVEWISLSGPDVVQTGQTVTFQLVMKNTSCATWPRERSGGYSVRVGRRWRSTGPPEQYVGRVNLDAPVAPGSTVTLPVDIRAPDKAGTYEIEVDLVYELVAWFSSHGQSTLRKPVTVTAP